MPRPHLLPLIVAIASAATFGADLPDKCKPFLDTVDRCERFEQITLSSGWALTYEQKFDKDVDLKAMTLISPQNIQDPEILRRLDQDGGVLKMDISNYQSGMLKIGPEVSGEFAIEMRAQTIGGRISDMSLLTNGLTQGPGFQFGGFANTRNVLLTGQSDRPAQPVNGVIIASNDGQSRVEGDKSVLITPQQYYRIRLEVRKDQVVGTVDGKVIAKGPVGNKHDFTKRIQPLIYVYASTVLIDEFRVESRERMSAPKDLEKAFKEAFAQKSRDEAVKDLTALCGLLNDLDWGTREGATRLLGRAGPMAIDPLKNAAASGPLEGRDRAKALLKQLGQPVSEE